MDGFDDLLAPSRNVLEENPFDDPFAKRSNSPDPWATPFANSVHDDSNPYADFGTAVTPTSPTIATNESTRDDDGVPTPISPVVHDEVKPEPVAQSDPLEAEQTRDEPPEDPVPRATTPPEESLPRSPGFRESVPQAFSETATIRPSETEEAHIPNTRGATKPTSPVPPTPISPTTESIIGSHAQPSPALSNTRGSISSNASADWGGSPLSQSSKPSYGFEQSLVGAGIQASESSGWHAHDGSTAKQVSEDDSDDDKPIGQTVGRLVAQAESHQNQPPTLKRNDIGLQPVFVITVDDPQKVGDPIRGFTMYTVHTRTTSPMFQKSAFSVLRRYSDFLWLYETLSSNNPGVVVPPVPEKNTFGRFDDQFVKQRRFALEKCIQKIANHPILGKDVDLKMFLESDTFALDIKHRKAEMAHERGGLMASIGQAVAGPRFYETDEWFDRQKVYLDSLESQLRGLAKAIDTVAKQRSELATATGEFAQSVSDLSASDVGKGLSHSLSGMADVERMAQEIQSTQSEQDLTTFMGTVDEYARLINSVRMAFASRVRTYHTWKQSESDLLRIKQSHEKNRAQGRIPPERLSYSLSQIAEAEKRAAESKYDYDHVSKLVKTEVARFEQERVSDFKDSLHAFLEGMIERQKQLIGAWENYQQMLLKKASRPLNGQETST